MSRYAVFRNGEQITPDYATKRAAEFVAFAKGFMIHMAADFPGDVACTVLAAGYEIRPATAEASDD